MSFSEQDLRRRLEAVASQAGTPRFALGDLMRQARRRRARATGAAAGSALAVAAIAVAVAVPAGQRGPSGRSGPAAGAGAGAPVAYVASSDSGTVTLINTATNRVDRQIKVPGAGFMAVSPDGKTVYVTGLRGVTPIGTGTGRAGRPVRVGRFPRYIAFTPSGKTAYVANYGSGTVTPISTATGRPGPAIPVGRYPEALVVTRKTAYVASFGSGTVTPISTATNKAGRPIRVRPTFSLLGGTPMVLTPNGKTVYVSTAHGVVPISTATNAAGKPIDAPTPLNPAENLVIMPDGGTVYASGAGRLPHTSSPVLHVTPIVSATGTELRSIKIGSGQGVLTISPDGATVYALSVTGLTPIDTATNKPGKLIAFPGPQAIAITPDGLTAYVTGGKGPVTPIRTATGTVLKPIKFGHSVGQMTIVIAPGR
jgi:hyaluronoglucosaminidase